ncbi:MAG: hypothetical protein COV66_10945 [Nitrospinae bacterium CG11_big_fil_rev_8_21_14_0_20_45_15]|nr:MAG: hypothetical protein COV66_10945 [Nitrospinae bacterium CG11_big_fil_rev_8_21_14_0_20_45_15]
MMFYKNTATKINSLRMRRIFYVLFLVCLSACTHPISEKFRSEVDTNVTFEQVLDSPDQYIGHHFLWGGAIAETRNLKNGTEVEMVQKELDLLGYPDRGDKTSGRFILFTKEYLEPTIYSQGRYLVGVGILREVRNGRVGEMEQLFPVLDLEEHHLWENYDSIPYPSYLYSFPPYWDPFYHTFRQSPYSARYW